MAKQPTRAAAPKPSPQHNADDIEVEMTTSLSGPLLSLAPRDRHRFPPDEAQRLIAAGFAVAIDD